MAAPGVKASARVVVEHRRGRSRCTTLASAPPLSFRVTDAALQLVGTAAGPVGGDDLTLDLAVAAGASLTVRSVAAQLVLPAPSPAPSTLRMTVEVGPGATLRWMPEPTVLVRGADHRLTTTLTLAAEADLVWRDEVVQGRHAEAGGSLLHRFRVERDGVPLLCTELALGPAWPTAAGPACTGAARVVASLLLVGAPARAALAHDGGAGLSGVSSDRQTRWASFPLAPAAILFNAVGDDLDTTRVALAEGVAGGGVSPRR